MIAAPHARTANEWRAESLRRGWSRRSSGGPVRICSHPALETILRKAALADGSADYWRGDDTLVRFVLLNGKVRRSSHAPGSWRR